MPEIKFKVSSSQIGEWLYNSDDTEFAEAMVAFWKMREKRNSNIDRKDFEDFSIEDFSKWITDMLTEIIPDDSECCQYAWWKGGTCE